MIKFAVVLSMVGFLTSCGLHNTQPPDTKLPQYIKSYPGALRTPEQLAYFSTAPKSCVLRGQLPRNQTLSDEWTVNDTTYDATPKLNIYTVESKLNIHTMQTGDHLIHELLPDQSTVGIEVVRSWSALQTILTDSLITNDDGTTYTYTATTFEHTAGTPKTEHLHFKVNLKAGHSYAINAKPLEHGCKVCLIEAPHQSRTTSIEGKSRELACKDVF
jgi:hypothetical protein